MTITKKNEMTIWDLEGKRATHRGDTGGVQVAAISGNGELLAVPNKGSIACLNGDDAKQVGVLTVEGSDVPSIAFSPDGQSIAAYVPYAVHIYSLKDGNLTKSISIAENIPNASLNWLGKYLFVNRKLLVDVEQGVPIWTYDTSGAASVDAYGEQLHALFANETGGTLVSLKLPHVAVEEMLKKKSSDKFYAVGPGSRFKVQANFAGMSANDQQTCRTTITNTLKNLGWVEDSQAVNEVVLTLAQIERQEAEFVQSDSRFGFGPPVGFGPFGRPTGPTTKVSAVPWKHSIVISARGAELFRQEMIVGIPGGVQLKEGETAQQAVDRFCQPSPDFFKNAKLPKQLLKPEYRDGFGKSKITERGIQ